MKHSTVKTNDPQEDRWPIDAEVIRVTISRALNGPVPARELADVRHALVGHLQLLMPEAQRLAGTRRADTHTAAAVNASVRWARATLDRPQGAVPLDATVRNLARAALPLVDLCVHLEQARRSE